MTVIYVTAIIMLTAILFLRLLAYHFEKKSRSSKWIETYLRLRKHNPYYGYIYALANKDDKAVIANYRRAVKRPNLRKYYPLLTILFCFYFHSTKGVNEEIAKLSSDNNKKFFMQWLKIRQNNDEFNDSSLASDHKWMEYTIAALDYQEQGKCDSANKQLMKACNHSNGIIYYILEKERLTLKYS
ncbi:hypothetical protein [Niallia sp. BSM11]|uniref:hypothetical protein n=1 Tax=Niallia sp. BSM11 TaxID=3391576 RepID=UPI00398539E9